MNCTQSIKAPVTISHTRMHLSMELQMSHLASGWEKHTSVILLEAALGKYLTFFNPVLTFKMLMLNSELEKATRSF